MADDLRELIMKSIGRVTVTGEGWRRHGCGSRRSACCDVAKF